MDVKQAARLMAPYAEQIPRSVSLEKVDVSASSEHLLWMIAQVINGKVKGYKAHRWLGYMQGVVVTLGVGTLEDMKQLNKSCTGPGDSDEE